MANIVLASNDQLAQNLAGWLITNLNFTKGPPINSLKDREELAIIAHDIELASGKDFIKNLLKYDFPMAQFKVFLFTCSAAGYDFSEELITPAERIANGLNRVVHASTKVVSRQWDSQGLFVKGNFIEVKPNIDITLLFSQLTL